MQRLIGLFSAGLASLLLIGTHRQVSPTPLPIASPAIQEIVVQVSSSSDDVNERDDEYDAEGTSVWIGNGGSAQDKNFAGLRFQDVPIPQGAAIQSARIEFYTPVFQQIELVLKIYADASSNSPAFSLDDRPSERTSGEQSVQFESDEPSDEKSWVAYGDLAPIIQEIVSRADWQQGNSLSLIIQGQSNEDWGRKFFTSFDDDPAFAPRLIITFQAP